MNNSSQASTSSKVRESTAEGALAAFKIIIENMPPVHGLVLGGQEVQPPLPSSGPVRETQLELYEKQRELL